MQAYIAALLTVGMMDAAWLTYRANYHTALFKSVQNANLTVRPIPAVLIYLLIPFAVLRWAIQDQPNLAKAIQNGALVGFVLYAFYDLTNYATFDKWTLEMTITDILWGTLVCATAAGIGFSFLRKE